MDERGDVLALHCSGGSPLQWNALRAAETGRRQIIAPGLLSRAPKSDRPFRLDKESQSLVAEILATGRPVHLVGHSYGGAVALNIAARIPDLVRSLSLYEPAVFHLLDPMDPDGAWALGDLDRIARGMTEATASGDTSKAARLLVEYWSGPSVWPSLSETARGQVQDYLPKARAEFEAMLSEPHSVSLYRALNLPVLILKGGRSFNPASLAGDRLAGALCEVRRVTIAGAAHMGPMTHARAVAAELSAFFERIERSPQPAAA